MQNTLNTLEVELEAIVSSLHVQYKKQQLLNEFSVQFLIEDFGVLLCGLHAADYSTLKDTVDRLFPSYRVVYVAVADSLLDKKEEIIWELVRSGYIRQIRLLYPTQFKNLLLNQDFGKQIINKRLKVWGDRAAYRYYVSENKEALNCNVNYLLTVDPSFFDYMPEELS